MATRKVQRCPELESKTVKRHVYVRGKRIPVYQRDFKILDGRAFKQTPRWKHLERKIELRRSLRGARKISTLIHECLHQMDHRLSEATVLRLEDGIFQMVEENPEVFSRLSDLLSKPVGRHH